MTEESLTLHMLRQIDQKLEKLLRRLSDENRDDRSRVKGANRLSVCAKEIAALTPLSVRQTDAVELLHEDRSR
jgi:hypothetical protein